MADNLNLVTIDFYNLRPKSRASVLLYEECLFRWCNASVGSGGGGRFCVEGPHNVALSILRLSINSREIFFETLDANEVLHQQLYACGSSFGELRGTIELPPGASVTLRSSVDSTSIIGKSSFSLSVKSER